MEQELLNIFRKDRKPWTIQDVRRSTLELAEALPEGTLVSCLMPDKYGERHLMNASEVNRVLCADYPYDEVDKILSEKKSE